MAYEYTALRCHHVMETIKRFPVGKNSLKLCILMIHTMMVIMVMSCLYSVNTSGQS